MASNVYSARADLGWLSGRIIFKTIMLGNGSLDLRLTGVKIIALMLVGLVTALYFVLWRIARLVGEECATYIKRNFQYARDASYLYDVLIKFFAIVFLFLADQSQWIAPLLMAFAGDYLLQGRLFTLSTKLTAPLGTSYIGGSILQFLMHSNSLLIPLTVQSH